MVDETLRDAPEQHVLLPGVRWARHSPTGHLVFVQAGRLLGVTLTLPGIAGFILSGMLVGPNVLGLIGAGVVA